MVQTGGMNSKWLQVHSCEHGQDSSHLVSVTGGSVTHLQKDNTSNAPPTIRCSVENNSGEAAIQQPVHTNLQELIKIDNFLLCSQCCGWEADSYIAAKNRAATLLFSSPIRSSQLLDNTTQADCFCFFPL